MSVSIDSSSSSANCGEDESPDDPAEDRFFGSAAGDVVSADADEICTLDSFSLAGVDDFSIQRQQDGEFADFEPAEEDVVVLAPHHPLLVNFHNSIFKHLSKQKEQLATDIKEMATKVRSQRKESDNLAEKLYIVQQTVHRQHAQLDVKTENAAASTELRQELEKCMKEFNDNHKNETKQLTDAQIFEEKLWRKLCDKLEKDYEDRLKAEEAEAKLALLKRQTEKATVDKKQLVEEKKKQDEFVCRLTDQVTELHALLAQLRGQIASKITESTQLQQAIKAGGADLEEQNREQHQLNQLWQRLLVAAKIKDTEYTRLQDKKVHLQESVKITSNATQEHKKGEEQEREKNDKLGLTFKRLRREKALLESQMSKQRTKIEELQEQMDKVNSMVGVAETDLAEIKRANRSKESRKNFIENELTGLVNKQLELERKILEALNEKTVQDKTVQMMIKKVDDMNLLLEQLEVERAQKDMQFANAELEIQKLKHEEAQMKQYLSQQVESVKQAQAENLSTEHELHSAQTELSVKQGKLNRLNIKLAKHLEKTGGKEMSPTEAKITEMEYEIKVLSENIAATQKTLLRREVALMDKNERICKMKREIDHLQKSIENLQHKSRGQVEELENLQLQRNAVSKKIETQAFTLSSVDKEIAKLRYSKFELEKSNLLQFSDMQSAMKEDEKKMTSLSEKLIALGEESKQLYENLRLLQADQVELEAKMTLANDTKQAIERERGSQGEIAAMKAEIHRMEVRLGQLKRAQEKLKLDLDQCVLRRESMVDAARVRSTKQTVANAARLKTLRKYETIKYNNKQLKSRLDKYENEKVSLKVIEKEIGRLSEELQQKKSDVTLIEEPLKSHSARLHALRCLKKEKLEHLVHEQKLVRGLGDAKDGKYKTVCKSEAILTTEAERQRVVHSNLISIVESLQPDFPQYGVQLHSTSSLLKSIKVNYPHLSAAHSIQETDDASSVQ